MICDQSLAAHSGRKAKTLQSFERHLKRTALFYEGVIVPDSDLNNNVRFQAATQNDEPGHTFVAEAIQSGFIVRAARKAPSGGPISQQQVYETLLSNNRRRAKQIPGDHAARLDEIFARSGQPSVMWDALTVASVFRARLLHVLQNLGSVLRGSPAEIDSARRLAEPMIGYLQQLEGEAAA
jgi:hypothetical protein